MLPGKTYKKLPCTAWNDYKATITKACKAQQLEAWRFTQTLCQKLRQNYIDTNYFPECIEVPADKTKRTIPRSNRAAGKSRKKSDPSLSILVGGETRKEPAKKKQAPKKKAPKNKPPEEAKKSPRKRKKKAQKTKPSEDSAMPEEAQKTKQPGESVMQEEAQKTNSLGEARVSTRMEGSDVELLTQPPADTEIEKWRNQNTCTSDAALQSDLDQNN